MTNFEKNKLEHGCKTVDCDGGLIQLALTGDAEPVYDYDDNLQEFSVSAIDKRGTDYKLKIGLIYDWACDYSEPNWNDCNII